MGASSRMYFFLGKTKSLIVLVLVVVTFLELVPVASSHPSSVRRTLAQSDTADDDEWIRCGNEHTTADDHQSQHTALLAYNAKRQWLVDKGALLVQDPPIITIPVCFHVTGDEEYFSKQQMQNQLDVLNRAYSANSCCDASLDWCDTGMCSIETGFRFAWAVLDDDNIRLVPGKTVLNVTDPNACASYVQPGIVTESKLVLRKGDASVLNVYWTQIPNKVLGYASGPWLYKLFPPGDGVTITHGTHWGSRTTLRYNEGDTLVHEVGHWLGLLHTFDGGCGQSDGIYDTAPEAEPYMGACLDKEVFNRDTCPDDNQTDPISNFMGYAYDACMYLFTPGQVQMMQACYAMYRLGNNRTERAEVAITSGMPVEEIFLGPDETQVFVLETTASSVTCDVTAQEGVPRLSLKWGQPPSFIPLLDDCSNDWILFQSSSCTARFRLWRAPILYASVRAHGSRPVQNLAITCTEN